jgi:DNA-binding transcriptional LysR family regulator
MSFIWEAVRADLGLALLPGVPGIPVELVRVLPMYGIPGAGLYVVIPSARHEPARVALLRETLVKELRAYFGVT